MRSDPLSGLGMKAFEIGIEVVLVDAPDAPAPEFYGRQLVTSYQGVGLGDADVEIGGNLLQRHESGDDGWSFAGVLPAGHGGSLTKLTPVWLHWPPLTSTGVGKTCSGPWTSP